MRELSESDYVIYDKANDHVVQFSNGEIIIFGNENESHNDCRGNEQVLRCTELPQHWKQILLNQIN